MAIIDTRRDQMFPKLQPAEIERLRRFGTVQRYAAGTPLFLTGGERAGMIILLAGRVAVTWHDGLGHRQSIIDLDAHHFLAEVGQLSGRPSLVDAYATRRRRSIGDLDREPSRARLSPKPSLASGSCAP